MKLTKLQHEYLVQQLAIIENNKSNGKKEEVPHLSESTKKALRLIGY